MGKLDDDDAPSMVASTYDLDKLQNRWLTGTDLAKWEQEVSSYAPVSMTILATMDDISLVSSTEEDHIVVINLLDQTLKIMTAALTQSILFERCPAYGMHSIPQKVVEQLKPILAKAGLLTIRNLDNDVVATEYVNIPSGSISDDDNDQTLLDVRMSQPSKGILVAKRQRQDSFVVENDSDASDQSAEYLPKSPTVARKLSITATNTTIQSPTTDVVWTDAVYEAINKSLRQVIIRSNTTYDELIDAGIEYAKTAHYHVGLPRKHIIVAKLNVLRKDIWIGKPVSWQRDRLCDSLREQILYGEAGKSEQQAVLRP